ncbi:MAG TPA: branched-chain amino acid ABC transporter permease [Chloroflexota bacterium]|nr:branched-chain amino acid ABC transporter permease [Chloroflexota bacterium]
MQLFFLSVGFGLVTASVVAIASVGLTLQFGVTNYVNFAYGDFLTLGAYLTWTLNSAFGWNFWLALIAGSFGVGVAALIISQVVLEPFVRKGGPLLIILVVTFGLSLILANTILAVWGADYKQYNVPLENPISIGPLLLTADQLGIIALSIAVMVAIHLVLTRTKLGKAMRAMSDDKNLASVSGIPARQVTALVWLLSGVLAGLGGGVLALNVATFDSSIGVTFLFVIFAAVILGGIGKPYGAMLGALIIGMAVELSSVWIPSQYKLDVAFVLLVLVLLTRPQGLMSVLGKA